jgi:hypothetical protein
VGRCVAECDRLMEGEGEYVTVWQEFAAEGIKVCSSAWQSMGVSEAVDGRSVRQCGCVRMCVCVCVCVTMYGCVWVLWWVW